MASNGALLYFLINNLHELDRVYHFSMANYVAILGKGAPLQPLSVVSSHAVAQHDAAWGLRSGGADAGRVGV